MMIPNSNQPTATRALFYPSHQFCDYNNNYQNYINSATPITTPSNEYLDDYSTNGLGSYKWGPSPITPIQSPQTGLLSPVSLPPIRTMGLETSSNNTNHPHLPPLSALNGHHHITYNNIPPYSPRSPTPLVLPPISISSTNDSRLPPPGNNPGENGISTTTPVNQYAPTAASSPSPASSDNKKTIYSVRNKLREEPSHHYQYYRYQSQPALAACKDIKRRTKTGCLTCRKRRIKCDEKYPTCLNCDKSKRICLGYDPVFRITTGKRMSRKPQPQTRNIFKTSSVISKYPKVGGLKINSLLDAADVLDSQTCEPRKGSDATPELVRWTSWSQLCQYYYQHIGPYLNLLFATERFTNISLSPNNSNGHDLATLEAVRKIIKCLCPTFYLNELAVDETKILKLEELQISNDYKLLRSVFQLLDSKNNINAIHRCPEILPTSDGDSDLYQRILAVYKFIHYKNYNHVTPPAYIDFNKLISTGTRSAIWSLLESLLMGSNENSSSEPTTASSNSPILSNEQIEMLLDAANRDILTIPILLALYCILSDTPAQSKIRYRLLDLSGSHLDLISQQLIRLVLHPY